MVFRTQLTYNENENILDTKFIDASTTGYTLEPGLYEISDITFMLKSLLPENIKMKITINDIKRRSNLSTNKTIRFTEKSFSFTILGCIQFFSGPLGDIGRYIQLLPGTYKSDKPFTITGIDKKHLTYDCINGSIVNGIREPFLYSFGLDKPPGHKIHKVPRINLFKKVKKPVLSLKLFYLEDHDYKSVILNNETISFTCQRSKI